MNQKFTIQGAEFKNINTGVEAKLGEITIEVTDLNLVEYIQLIKAVPSMAREIGETVQGLIERNAEFSLNHAREVAEFEQEQREQHMANMPSFSFGFPFGCMEGCNCEEVADEDLPFGMNEDSNDDDDFDNDDDVEVSDKDEDFINDEELASTSK